MYAYNMKTLGERIKELRDEADLSLRELGKKAGGLSPVFLSDIELGRRFPSENALKQIAAALNERGITAPRGGQWHAAQVKAVFRASDRGAEVCEST